MTKRVGIIGATGFTGAELIRLLVDHPHFEITCVTSDSSVGMLVSDLYHSFEGVTSLRFASHEDEALFECDLVFLAVPHTAAMKYAPRFLEKGISVFDLSADFRLKDPDVYLAHYGIDHQAKSLLKQAAFGLPELCTSEIARAQAAYAAEEAVLVACAGCYPTASSLAAYPALAFRDITRPVIVDAISGISGAGKKATEKTHFCSADSNVEAYAVNSHRHTPEIEQILSLPDQVIFTPHLAPLKRGLLSTVYIPLTGEPSFEQIESRYLEAYGDASFVTVLPEGKMPKTSSVLGSNNAHIGFSLNEKTNTLIAVGAIDNLCKGASGQAIQCANIVCGFPEATGLPRVAMPV